MSLYQAQQKARSDHKTTLHNEGGFMWSECKCGWQSRKRDCYDNYQVTGAAKDGSNHTNQQESLAWSAHRTAHRTALQSDFQ